MTLLVIANAPSLPAACYALLAVGIAIGSACIVAAFVVFWPAKGAK